MPDSQDQRSELWQAVDDAARVHSIADAAFDRAVFANDTVVILSQERRRAYTAYINALRDLSRFLKADCVNGS